MKLKNKGMIGVIIATPYIATTETIPSTALNVMDLDGVVFTKLGMELHFP